MHHHAPGHLTAFVHGLPEVQTVREGTRISYQVVVHGLANPNEAAAARTEAMALGAPRALIVSGS